LMLVVAQGPIVVARICLDLSCTCKCCPHGCGTACCGKLGLNGSKSSKTKKSKCCKKVDKILRNDVPGVIRVTDDAVLEAGMFNLFLDEDCVFSPFEYETSLRGKLDHVRPSSATSSSFGPKSTGERTRVAIELAKLSPEAPSPKSKSFIPSNSPLASPRAEAYHVQGSESWRPLQPGPLTVDTAERLQVDSPDDTLSPPLLRVLSPPFLRAQIPGNVSPDEKNVTVHQKESKPKQHQHQSRDSHIDEVKFDKDAGLISHHTKKHEYFYPADDENAITELDRHQTAFSLVRDATTIGLPIDADATDAMQSDRTNATQLSSVALDVGVTRVTTATPTPAPSFSTENSHKHSNPRVRRTSLKADSDVAKQKPRRLSISQSTPGPGSSSHPEYIDLSMYKIGADSNLTNLGKKADSTVTSKLSDVVLLHSHNPAGSLGTLDKETEQLVTGVLNRDFSALKAATSGSKPKPSDEHRLQV